MAIPPAVAKQAKAADKMILDNAAAATAGVGTGAIEAAPIVEGAVVSPPPPARSQEPPAAAVQPAQPPPAQPQTDTWEQRYKVLQGKYNAEVPVLSRANQEKDGQISRLMIMVEDLQAKLQSFINQAPAAPAAAQPAAAAAPGAQPQARSFKRMAKEEFDGYGSEVVEFAENYNALVEDYTSLLNRVAQIERRVGDVDQTVRVTQQETIRDAQARFHADLTSLVPDWEVWDPDPNFSAWLDEPTSHLSSHKRRDDLNAWIRAKNAKKVAQFFIDFKESFGVAQTPPTQTVYEQLVEPSSSVAGGKPIKPQNQPAGQRIDDQQYKKACDDFVRGRLTKEQYDKIDKAYWAQKRT